MGLLKAQIIRGWPNTKRELPAAILPYFDHRDELTVQDGIVLRGVRVVIPPALRRDIKVKVHSGHLGINSCLRWARDLVFWPGMSAEIRQYVEQCATCAAYSDRQPAEPLVMRPVPDRPFSQVATDIFTLSGRDYLITADCYSNFIEMDYLRSLQSWKPTLPGMGAQTLLSLTTARSILPQCSSSLRETGTLITGHRVHTTASQMAEAWLKQAEAAVKSIKRMPSIQTRPISRSPKSAQHSNWGT